mmetsp:Transcript_152283/g.469154  ORF Transcript_152283/g.469154 Transcript_152283/m.469154 type:complete len:229 (+) Transcript_152283:364-1050(+)
MSLWVSRTRTVVAVTAGIGGTSGSSAPTALTGGCLMAKATTSLPLSAWSMTSIRSVPWTAGARLVGTCRSTCARPACPSGAADAARRQTRSVRRSWPRPSASLGRTPRTTSSASACGSSLALACMRSRALARPPRARAACTAVGTGQASASPATSQARRRSGQRGTSCRPAPTASSARPITETGSRSPSASPIGPRTSVASTRRAAPRARRTLRGCPWTTMGSPSQPP